MGRDVQAFMKVPVRIRGKIHPIDADPFTTIKHLRDMVAAISDVPVETLRVILNGKQCDDNMTLNAYEMNPDSEVAIIVGDPEHAAHYNGIEGDSSVSAVLPSSVPFNNCHVIKGDITGQQGPSPSWVRFQGRWGDDLRDFEFSNGRVQILG